MTSRSKPWIRARIDTKTVMIFIHGVNSEASACWKSEKAYWPDIVKRDKKFSHFDIFTPDYFTGINASDYGISDCASELIRQFKSPSTLHGRTVFSYEKIVIVAHSFGGIISRYIIESQREKFSKKTIGLVLMASPSHGSFFAKLLNYFTWPYKHKQRDELIPFNSLLDDLNIRFKRLVHSKDLDFELIGIEAYEQSKLFGLARIVSKNSATPYFGESVHIQGSTHSSIVKPENIDHPSHKLLTSFCEDHFREKLVLARAPVTIKSDFKKFSQALFDVYQPDCEQFYLVRPIDRNSSQAARFRSIWFYGESGVGKTSVARRLLGSGLHEAVNIYLANCALPLSENIEDEILQALRGKCENSKNFSEIGSVASELSNFASKSGRLNVLIDEVSISTDEIENKLILQRVSHLLQEIRVINSSIDVLFIIISLNKPIVKDDVYPGKFVEFFQIINIPNWMSSELEGLSGLIGDSDIEPSISDISNKAISNSPVTPRELKTQIRDSLILLNN